MNFKIDLKNIDLKNISLEDIQAKLKNVEIEMHKKTCISILRPILEEFCFVCLKKCTEFPEESIKIHVGNTTQIAPKNFEKCL